MIIHSYTVLIISGPPTSGKVQCQSLFIIHDYSLSVCVSLYSLNYYNLKRQKPFLKVHGLGARVRKCEGLQGYLKLLLLNIIF